MTPNEKLIKELREQIQYLQERLQITEESRTHALHCQSELQLMLDQERSANGNKDRSIPLPRRSTMQEEETKEQLERQVLKADIEVKKQQAELLKAQTRRENAAAANLESDSK